MTESVLHSRVDMSAIVAWVASKRGSEHTRRAFGIEARRWLAWIMWIKADEQNASWLDKATPLDAAAYAKFLQEPKNVVFPAKILRAAALTRQPFKETALKPASVERAISALKTMYADLIEMTLDHGSLTVFRNPFARVTAASVAGKSSPREKALTAIERGYIQEALDEMRRAGNKVQYHQQKWIWTALLWGALRRHELAKAVAGDIFQDSDDRGETIWMLDVHGKDSMVSTIPLSKEFMDGFCEYRFARDLGPGSVETNEGNEKTPLVLPLRGQARNVHSETINRSVKKLLGHAAEIAIENGNPAAASRLKSFSSHSARHTQVTMIVDATGDITLGQEMARHVSIATTRRYKANSMSRLSQALRHLGAEE